MSWFNKRGDYSTNTQSGAPGAGRHEAADPTPSQQSEEYKARHGAEPYQGQHRAGSK
jgi:hypothetical protein